MIIRYPGRAPNLGLVRDTLRQWRTREQRELAAFHVEGARVLHGKLPPMPLRVTLTRVAPDVVIDVNAALEATRHGVADALNTTATDPEIEWRFDQRVESPASFVEITIETRSPS